MTTATGGGRRGAGGAGATSRAGASRRGARRALVYMLSFVPAIVALVFGVHFVTLSSTFRTGMDYYEDDEYGRAAAVFTRQQSMNPVESWKAYFNAGTAAYLDGQLVEADTALLEALDRVPELHRCDVLTNWGFVLEALGDSAMERAREYGERAIAVLEAELAHDAGEDYDEALLGPDADGHTWTSDELMDEAEFWERGAQNDYAAAVAAWSDPVCDPPEQEQEESDQDESDEGEPGQDESDQDESDQDESDQDESDQDESDQDESDQDESDQDQDQQDQDQQGSDLDRAEEKLAEAEQLQQDREQARDEALQNAQPDDGTGESDEAGEAEQERAAREEAERQQELDQRNRDANEGGGPDGFDDDGDDDQGGSGGGGSDRQSNW